MPLSMMFLDDPAPSPGDSRPINSRSASTMMRTRSLKNTRGSHSEYPAGLAGPPARSPPRLAGSNVDQSSHNHANPYSGSQRLHPGIHAPSGPLPCRSQNRPAARIGASSTSPPHNRGRNPSHGVPPGCPGIISCFFALICGQRPCDLPRHECLPRRGDSWLKRMPFDAKIL